LVTNISNYFNLFQSHQPSAASSSKLIPSVSSVPLIPSPERSEFSEANPISLPEISFFTHNSCIFSRMLIFVAANRRIGSGNQSCRFRLTLMLFETSLMPGCWNLMAGILTCLLTFKKNDLIHRGLFKRKYKLVNPGYLIQYRLE
jgi:hypothetical protein